MIPLGWALMQYDWYPYKKRKRHHEHAYTEEQPCEDATRGWNPGICKPKETGLKGN